MAKKRPKVVTIDLPSQEPGSTDSRRPIFCLEHLHPDHDLKNSKLTKDARASFSERLQELAGQSWRDIKLSGRHKQGYERLPVGQLKCRIPEAFQDVDKVEVFRYHGKLPMVGVRSGAVLHIFAIERQFGEVYDH